MRVLDLIKAFAIFGVLLFVGCSDNGNGNGGGGKGDVNYTLTFDSRGGTNVNSITRTSGTSVILPSTSRGGYTFNGWYSSSSGGSRYGGSGSSYTITGDVTMYAQWTEGNVVVGGETQTISGIECVLVQAGTFMMGRPDERRGTLERRAPTSGNADRGLLAQQVSDNAGAI
jgi:uncharacterized repeat protein (TIGR02543 family)